MKPVKKKVPSIHKVNVDDSSLITQSSLIRNSRGMWGQEFSTSVECGTNIMTEPIAMKLVF